MNRKLVTIEREKFSEENLYGFILKESKKLLMIRQIFDFRTEGILVINKKEISDCYSSLSDDYETEILKEFGIYQTIDFNIDYNIKNWRSFFESSHQDFPYCQIYRDTLKTNLFYIGKIVQIKKNSLRLHEFSRAGNWYKKPTKIKYDDISTCGIGMYYTQMYVDYFSLIQSRK